MSHALLHVLQHTFCTCGQQVEFTAKVIAIILACFELHLPSLETVKMLTQYGLLEEVLWGCGDDAPQAASITSPPHPSCGENPAWVYLLTMICRIYIIRQALSLSAGSSKLEPKTLHFSSLNFSRLSSTQHLRNLHKMA